MRMRLPYPLCAGGALAAALVLTACIDEPSAPTGAVGNRLAPALAVSARPAGLIPNALRYRDSGHQPATGRSGNAQLTLRAMLDVNGWTAVEVTTGRFDTTAAPPGQIVQSQLKIFQPEGKLVFARRDTVMGGGYLFIPLRGLGLGFGVQVQANVRGIDDARADVVTVRDTVVFRPDLAVVSLQLPLGARPGIPLPVSATIRERMGSMGARADCSLFVDGALVDRAKGIWVDRSGIVSCAFMHVFPELRRYQVTVQVDNVRPGDYDYSNNGRSEFLELRNAFGYTASFSDYSDTYFTRSSWYGSTSDKSSGYSYVYHAADSSHYQNALLHASMPRLISFPVARVRLAQQSGGYTIQDTTLSLPADITVLGADSSYSCGIRFGDGWWFELCSGTGPVGPPSTWLDLNRYAGEALYYSYVFSRSWYPGGESYYYSYYSYPEYQYGTIQPWALPTYDFIVAVDDGTGVWATNPQVPLSFFVEHGNNLPPDCTTWEQPGDPPWHYNYCTQQGYFRAGHAGQVVGQPDTLTFTP